MSFEAFSDRSNHRRFSVAFQRTEGLTLSSRMQRLEPEKPLSSLEGPSDIPLLEEREGQILEDLVLSNGAWPLSIHSGQRFLRIFLQSNKETCIQDSVW